MTTQARPCPDDLTDRHRRAVGSELEQRALAAHLDQCDSCKAAVMLAGMFDAMAATAPGDEQIIARVAARAANAPRMFARRSRVRVWAIAAGLVIVCAATGAGAWMLLGREKPAGRPGGTALEHDVSARARRSGGLPVASPGAPVADSVDPSPSLPPAAPTPGVAPPRSGTKRRAPIISNSAATGPPTAETLFAEANAVRRAGQLRRAIALYHDLQRRFPGSEEARSSSISLGNLLLGLGEFQPAAAAFDSYLTRPTGDMTEEALFGRGRVFARLGRDVDESATWTELLRRFPQSAYRSFATKRLEALRGRQSAERPGPR